MSRTPGSGKTFFIQYLTEYYMLLKKKIILIATTRCVVQKLNCPQHISYTMKRICSAITIIKC